MGNTLVASTVCIVQYIPNPRLARRTQQVSGRVFAVITIPVAENPAITEDCTATDDTDTYITKGNDDVKNQCLM